MKHELTCCLLIVTTLIWTSCGSDNQNFNEKSATSHILNPEEQRIDTVELKETFNQEDLPVNEYMTEELKPIRANFKRINSISNWTSVKANGQTKFYYLDGKLEKIAIRNVEEKVPQLTEYYLLNEALSLVIEQSYSTEMQEMTEDRSYFENGKMLHQLNNQDCGSPFAEDYLLEEQKRIKADFDELQKLK